MSLSMPKASRTFTILSGVVMIVAPRLAGSALASSDITLFSVF
jgi:hypothetical protein